MRVWCRMLTDDIPSGINVTAAIGFKMLGENVVYYQKIDEILDQISRNDIVVDGVQPSKRVFHAMNIKPATTDYPPVLYPFLQRKIWDDKIGRVRRFAEYPVFVKPVEEKLFTGKVIRSISDWAPLVNIALKEPVHCSEVIDIRSEFRVFVRYDQILDVRPYHGDYHYQYNPERLDSMLATFITWEGRPHAGAIDVAVTGDRETVFLEFNDGYAIGTYGLEPSVYARFLATRWTQLMDVPDPYAMDGFTI